MSPSPATQPKPARAVRCAADYPAVLVRPAARWCGRVLRRVVAALTAPAKRMDPIAGWLLTSTWVQRRPVSAAEYHTVARAAQLPASASTEPTRKPRTGRHRTGHRATLVAALLATPLLGAAIATVLSAGWRDPPAVPGTARIVHPVRDSTTPIHARPIEIGPPTLPRPGNAALIPGPQPRI